MASYEKGLAQKSTYAHEQTTAGRKIRGEANETLESWGAENTYVNTHKKGQWVQYIPPLPPPPPPPVRLILGAY